MDVLSLFALVAIAFCLCAIKMYLSQSSRSNREGR